MNKELYVVVDAGGAPYQGTYAKTKDQAIGKRVGDTFPGMTYIMCDHFNDRWRELQEEGDRCVKCIVSTQEIVNVRYE